MEEKMMEFKPPHPLIDLTDTSYLNETATNLDTTGLQSFNVKIRSRHGSAISYPRDVMTMVWKRVKRSGHQASKYSFNISFKELIIDAERKPEKVQIAVMHRRRRYACESRPLEKSFSSENKYMIVWPDLAADALNFNTTLFKDPAKEQFDNKEWTLIAEEITKKGKVRPLAAVQLNFAFFVNQNPDVKTELKLKLRCLQKEINNCTLSLILSSTLVKEGHAMDDDIQSQASVSSVKIPIDIPLGTDDESNEKITEGVKKITKDFEDWKRDDVKERKEEIAIKPTPPPQIKQAWGEGNERAVGAERRNEEQQRRHSRNDPPPPLPPHRLSSSTSRHQSDSFEHDIVPSVSGQQHPPSSHIQADRRQSIHTVIKNLPPPPPTPKKDEPLLDWCQRVTAGYKGIKITDFSRSWRSGLAFCAILHRYDPSLIGEFDDLDFSGTKPGQKENCKRAFDAAKTIGVERALDESEITTYPDEKKITLYLSSLRAALQGTEWAKEALENQRKSEYRISTVYGLSETEKNVMRDLERMRLLRGNGEDETDRMELQPRPVEPVKMTEGKVTSKFRMTSTSNDDEPPKGAERNDEPKPFGRSRRASIKELDDHQAELERMQDEMKRLADEAVRESLSPKSPPPPAPFEPKLNGTNNTTPNRGNIFSDEEQSQRRKEEAQRLIEELRNNTSGDAITISSVMKQPQRGRQQQQQQYNYYSVRSAQASPAYERKNYGHQRHGSDLSANAYFSSPSSTNNGLSTNPRNAQPGMQPSPSAFDRVKRYGSMRGAELAETLSQFIAPVIPADSSRAYSQPYDNSLNATPTRKIVTSFEKNVIHVEDINEELAKIAERIKEVENLDEHVQDKLRCAEENSEDEQKYMVEHMKLLNEKDALVRKQDYFNVAAEMSEVKEKLGIVEQQVNEVTTMNDVDKTEEEKQRIDDLVEEYKSLINKKNELAEILIQKEAEEEEHAQFGRDTLERSQNFMRGSQEPLNTSRRIINWIKSTTS